MNQAVFTRRVVVGNRQLKVSAFGTPRASAVDAGGNVDQRDYLTDPTFRAGSFNNVLPMQPGQIAYMAEAYVASPDLDWTGVQTGSGSYSRAIF